MKYRIALSLSVLALTLVEVVSWALSRLPPQAIEQPSGYSTYYDCSVNFGVLWCGTANIFNWVGRGDHLTAISTAIIAFFTATLFLATREQGRLTEKTASIAKDSLIVGNAAFVFANDFSWSWSTAPDDLKGNIVSYSFRPIWRNSGNTQTKNMLTMVAFELSDSIISDQFDFTATKTTPQAALIGPKSKIIGGQERDITIEEMEAVGAAKKFLYLWGWTTYQDIFPDTKPHLTRYCIQVRAAGDLRSRPPKDGPGPFISFSIHARGNCADDECRLQNLV